MGAGRKSRGAHRIPLKKLLREKLLFSSLQRVILGCPAARPELLHASTQLRPFQIIRKLFKGSGSRRISQDELGGNLIFLALRISGAREFMKSVGCHLPQHVPVYVHRGD